MDEKPAVLRYPTCVPIAASILGASVTADRIGHRRLWGQPSGAGYFLTLGWHDRRASVLMREENTVLSNDKSPTLEAGKTCHVVAQFIPPRAMLVVDGQVVLDYRDQKWLPNLDTISLFGWTADRFDNVRIFGDAAP